MWCRALSILTVLIVAAGCLLQPRTGSVDAYNANVIQLWVQIGSVVSPLFAAVILWLKTSRDKKELTDSTKETTQVAQNRVLSKLDETKDSVEAGNTATEKVLKITEKRAAKPEDYHGEQRREENGL